MMIFAEAARQRENSVAIVTIDCITALPVGTENKR